MQAPSFWQRLSLQTADEAVARGFEKSLLLAPLRAPLQGVKSRLQPWVASSYTQTILPYLAVFSTLLLLFALPFVSSGQSALLVLACSAITFLRVIFIQERYALGSLVLSVCVFVGWGLVASGFSPFLKLSLYGYAKSLTYFLCYLCFLVNLRDAKAMRGSLWAIALSAIIVSLYGLYQWHIKVPPLALWDDPDSTNFTLTRVYSFLGNPNLLGGYLLPTLSFTIFFAFNRPWWGRILLAFAALVQIACIYFTYSRGAWIALVALVATGFLCFLMLFWHRIGKSKSVKTLLFAGVVVMVLGVLGFVLTNPALLERVRSLSSTEHSSNNFRINVWRSSLEMIQVYGLTGIGMGNKVFVKMYTYYMATGFRALSTYNIFLEIWLEMGLLGFLIFLGMLSLHALRCVWGFFSSGAMAFRLMLAGAFCASAALLVHGMVDTVFFRPPVQILFWYALALITLASRQLAVATDDVAPTETE